MTPALHTEIQKILDRQGTSDLALHIPLLLGDTTCGVLSVAKVYHTAYAHDEIASLTSVAGLIASYLH